MPAMLDDPSSPTIYRTSGQAPFPGPYDELASDIVPRQVTLRDRVTTATLLPFSSPAQVPQRLTACLCDLLNREIEKGDTYPMMEPMALSHFATYWFSNFGAIMVLGDIQSPAEVMQMEDRGVDWGKECLGSFYIKPNYTGRSSHVCNGGFLVTDAARNRGVGRLMGEGYLEWAPKLGYTYSVFNLVYETNVASLRIWDALGFKRIGRVKGCGNLRSYPDQYIDAIIFGRELGDDGEDYVSEERFDKIRFYLKTGTYPVGSDRAEKSRLRSAATHYRLVPNTSGDGGDGEKLMLKGKEVISDPHKQYEIARNVHVIAHGGINKTTASIAEKYHWVRIKETVSAAIRNCPSCKDSAAPNKALRSSPTLGATPSSSSAVRQSFSNPTGMPSPSPSAGARASGGISRATVTAGADIDQSPQQPSIKPGSMSSSPSAQHHNPYSQQQQQQQQLHRHQHRQQQQPAPPAQMLASPNHYNPSPGGPGGSIPANDYGDMPVDPQIMQGIEHHHHHHHHHHHNISWTGGSPNVADDGSTGLITGGRGGGGSGRNMPGAGGPGRVIGSNGSGGGAAGAGDEDVDEAMMTESAVVVEEEDVASRLREQIQAQMLAEEEQHRRAMMMGE